MERQREPTDRAFNWATKVPFNTTADSEMRANRGEDGAQAEHPLHFRPATSFTLCCLLLVVFIPTAYSLRQGWSVAEGVRAKRVTSAAEDQPWGLATVQSRVHPVASSAVSSLMRHFFSSSFANLIAPKRTSHRPSFKASNPTSSPANASLRNNRFPCQRMSPWR